jgi:hypothetical protein
MGWQRRLLQPRYRTTSNIDFSFAKSRGTSVLFCFLLKLSIVSFPFSMSVYSKQGKNTVPVGHFEKSPKGKHSFSEPREQLGLPK